MTFLRKTNEAQAIQFTKENFDDFLEVILGKNDEGVVFTDEMKEEIINIGFGMKTPQGELKITKGDWLVIDNGKYIIYSDKEFQNSFIVTINMN